MHDTKSSRLKTSPRRHTSRRVGADAAFAKAMARAEFGRFYTDEQEQREVARSLARAKHNGKAGQTLDGPRRGEDGAKRAAERDPADAGKKGKAPTWRQPSLRERRTELAEAKARLRSNSRAPVTSEE